MTKEIKIIILLTIQLGNLIRLIITWKPEYFIMLFICMVWIFILWEIS
jgi:hypothetical protein